MEIVCEKCREPYHVMVEKTRLAEKPSGVIEEREGSRTVRYRWWNHPLEMDLRKPAVALVLVVVWVAYGYVPSGALEAVARDPLGHWPTLGNLTLVAMAAYVVLRWILRTLIQQRVVEYDGLRVRAWAEPMGGPAVEVPFRSIEQLYVSSDGELRCRTGFREHVSLGRGRPLSLRYVEQQLEEQLLVQDVNVEGEWQKSWDEIQERPCPNCGHRMSRKQLMDERPLAAKPADVQESRGRDLLITRPWRSAVLIFLSIWLLFWDSVVFAFVAGGLSAVARGNLSGLAVFLIPHVWVGVGMTYFWLASLLNSTRIRCGSTILRIETGPLPWPGYPKEVRVDDVDQLYVVQHAGSKTTTYTLEVKTKSGQTVVLERNPDPSFLKYVEQAVERHLRLADQKVSGEWRPS